MEKDLEEVTKVAKEVITHCGSHPSTLFVTGEKGKVFTNFPDFGPDHEDKVRQMANMGVKIACQRNIGDLNYLIFVTEAWMSWLAKGKSYVQPSKDPKHIEVLTLSTLDVPTHKQTMLAYQMERDKSGNLIELEKLPLPDGVAVESPLLPAFIAGYNLIAR
jgi:hypothetical protein